MRRVLLVLVLVCSSFAASATADVLGAIDARYRDGRIDEGTWHLLRVAAVRRRAALPEDLRGLPPGPDGGARLTEIMFSAYQWALQHRSLETSGVVLDLLIPHADLANVIDSQTLPIRVSYADPALAALAAATLAAAEVSWTVETGDYGFLVPPLEPGLDRYRMFVEPIGFRGAYTVPYAENPATPWSDCYSFISVDTSYTPQNVQATVAHELNHAMQSAYDCWEVTTFMENTSTYIMGQVFPAQLDQTLPYAPYFQNYPWRALDYMAGGTSDLYEYGGFVFTTWLGDAYGAGDGPVLLRKIWEDCRQDETAGSNSRTYYQAVPNIVGQAGGPTTMEEVLVEFSEARFLTGAWADGHHIGIAAQIAPVAPDVTLRMAQLPVTYQRPEDLVRPAPYGSNFIVVDLAGADYPVSVSFDGDDDTRWAARVLVTGPAGTTATDLALDATTFSGSAEIDAAGQTTLVLVVANLGTPTYSPNDRSWPVSSFTYSLEPRIPPPTVTGADPPTLSPGAGTVNLRVLGTGFVAGRGFTVTFDDPALRVAGVLGVTPTVATVILDVGADARLGPTQVTVTNGSSQAASGPGPTLVAAPGPDGGTTGGGGGSGGCQAGGAGAAPQACALVVALLLCRVARRRRRG